MSVAEFRRWIQTVPSCLTGHHSEYLEDGHVLNIAAHVRRSGKSGTAYKEEFACIPMRRDQHDYQHQHGELACLQRFAPRLHAETVQEAKEIFDAFAALYRRRWFADNPADLSFL
jgi:hypothetical protein